jgi:NitT/TauT family transport system ATP-binding protein
LLGCIVGPSGCGKSTLLRAISGLMPPGGMPQRVAIAPALVCEPTLLLMDEPFAAVDAQTRAELEDLLLRVRRAYNTTVLLVTHDIDESVYLGDRVLVLSQAPSTVIADIDVTPLGPDRDQIITKETGEFVHLRGEVARLLRHGTGRKVDGHSVRADRAHSPLDG